MDDDAGRWGRVHYSIVGDGIPEPLPQPQNRDDQNITLHSDQSSLPHLQSHDYQENYITAKNFLFNSIHYEHSQFESLFSPSNSPTIRPRIEQKDSSQTSSSIIHTLLQTNSSSILRSPFHKSLLKYYQGNSSLPTPSFTVDPLRGTVFVMKVSISLYK